MTARALWGVIRFNWLFLVAATSLGGALGAGAAQLSDTEYTASAEVYVAVNDAGDATEIAQGATYSQQQARNFAAVATRELVLQPVIDDLGLDLSLKQMRDKMSTSVPLNTSIITISVTDGSPELAAETANTIAESLSDSIDELVPSSSSGSPQVRLESVQDATAPSLPSAPRTNLLVAVGALLLLALALGVVAVRDVLRAKVRTPEQASELTGAPVVGIVSYAKNLSRAPMVTAHDAGHLRAEEYRQIRTNLRFLQMDEGHKVFVVTSAIPGEGKSTTAANVAGAIAADGASVCLVEADLRRPSLAQTLDLEGGVGLTTVLAGGASIDDVLQPWGEDGLQVMLAGEQPPNPSELLGSRHTEALLRTLQERFDVVVIDAPPLIPVTDAAILARMFGGAILVVSEQRVEVRDLRRSVERMGLVEAPIIGTVVTMSREKGGNRRYYQSYATEKSAAEPKSPTGSHIASSWSEESLRSEGSDSEPRALR